MSEITMPKLSDTMQEGKILRWLKHPGDTVRYGDVLAEVETDKADMVLEAFEEGVLEELKLGEGESAQVGSVIAVLSSGGEVEKREEKPQAEKAAEAGEAASASVREAAEEEAPLEAAWSEAGGEAEKPYPSRGGSREEHVQNGISTGGAIEYGGEEPTAQPSPARAEPALRVVEPPPSRPKGRAPAEESRKLKASPLARRAAEEADIDITQVRGSGPDGRITKRDVDNYLREQQLFRFRRLVAPREGAPGSREELSAMRKTIARRMAASKREIPHFYVTVEVDMEEAVKLKNSLEATELFDEDVSFNDIIIKATALALGRFTRMNATYEDESVVIYPHINIGVAVAIEDGLVVPVIRECERLSLPEVARAAHRLVTKASQGGFTSDELSGGTFTISNMGMLGIEHFSAVINPPQAAILAVSAIKDRAVVRNGHVVVGKTMMVTVSCDHRVIDGVVAGRFLQELKRFLENPASLLV